MAFNGRGKNKIQKPLVLKNSYEYYIKDIKLDSKYNVEWSQYKSILSAFNKECMRSIVEDGFIFKMPYRIGVLRIKKRQNNLDRLKFNYSLLNTSDNEHKTMHLNDHTNNWYVRFYWAKSKECIIKNKSIYSFIPTRDNKRYIATLLKEEGMNQMNKYFE